MKTTNLTTTPLSRTLRVLEKKRRKRLWTLQNEKTCVKSILQIKKSLLKMTVETTKYDWFLTEQKKDLLWRFQRLQKVKPLNRKRFTVVLPPPNVTGQLHLGHAWNAFLQDALVRYKKIQGYNTLFLPATDHAGIATQAKVEEKLNASNITRLQLGRQSFVAKVREWQKTQTKFIHKQWSKMGLLLDYPHERFTLDNNLKKAVNQAFCYLAKKNLVFQDTQPVNWDTVLQTSVSNIEVEPRPAVSAFYYVRYTVKNSNQSVIVATTRPETIFSDVAVAFNSKDKRYQKLRGKTLLNPLTQEELPVISDSYVATGFGSGLMKVSAHSADDIAIIKGHSLKIKECIGPNGKMNFRANSLQGLDRFVARKKVAKLLKNKGLLVDTKTINNFVAYSKRSNSVVETLVLPQWYVRTKPLAAKVLTELQSKGGVKFCPSRFKSVITQWLTKIENWNVSRQLWWGHRLPIWKKNKVVLVKTSSPGKGWVQDPDVLDTWFSSGLAPFSFLGWPHWSKGASARYPLDVMVTAYDIIFFWVARMYMQGIALTKQKPFKTVLIHGLIRDDKGRKMSKSLGNGVDPRAILAKHGNDVLRWFLITNTTFGHDLNFNSRKLLHGWQFANKLWNVFRFLTSVPVSKQTSDVQDQDVWILNRLASLVKSVEQHYDNYSFNAVGKVLHHFLFNVFATWYIEMSKKRVNIKTAAKVAQVFLILLAPVMPFLSEHLHVLLTKKSVYEVKWPKLAVRRKRTCIPRVIKVTQAIRAFRVNNRVSPKQTVYYHLTPGLPAFGQKLVEQLVNAKVRWNQDFLVPVPQVRLYVQHPQQSEEERLSLRKKLVRLQSEVARSTRILQNPQFLKKADPTHVANEQKKLLTYKKQLAIVQNRLNQS